MSSIIELRLKNQSVQIEKGELISFRVDGYEFIHQKGSPGWSSSDTEMFPIIGPVNEADFKVNTPKGLSPQDQHGHLRQMEYNLVSKTPIRASYKKTYKANTPVVNAKFPEKSTLEWMHWPYSFEFEKVFELTALGLSIDFIVSGDNDMPFMLGYHPAFRLTTNSPNIYTNDKNISLDEVIAVGGRALHIPNCTTITLKDEKEITIKTKGFNHFMCWTEVANMVCIEPISFYPYAVSQQDINEGFQFLKEDTRFKVVLSVGG